MFTSREPALRLERIHQHNEEEEDDSSSNSCLRALIRLHSSNSSTEMEALLLELEEKEVAYALKAVTEVSLEFVSSDFNNKNMNNNKNMKMMRQLMATLGEKMPRLEAFKMVNYSQKIPQVSILALLEFFAHAPASFKSFISNGAVSWTGNQEDFQALAQTLKKKSICPQLEDFQSVEILEASNGTTTTATNSSNSLALFLSSDKNTTTASSSSCYYLWDPVVYALLSRKTHLHKLVLCPSQPQRMTEKTTRWFCRRPPLQFLFHPQQIIVWETKDLKNVVYLAERSMERNNLFLHFHPFIEQTTISPMIQQWLSTNEHENCQNDLTIRATATATCSCLLPTCSIPISRRADQHIPIHFAVPPPFMDRTYIRQTLVLGLLQTSQAVFVGKAYGFGCDFAYYGGYGNGGNGYNGTATNDPNTRRTTTTIHPNSQINRYQRPNCCTQQQHHQQNNLINNHKNANAGNDAASFAQTSLFWALERHQLWNFNPEMATDHEWMQFLAILGQLKPTIVDTKKKKNGNDDDKYIDLMCDSSPSPSTSLPPEPEVHYDISGLYSFLRQHPTELIAMKLLRCQKGEEEDSHKNNHIEMQVQSLKEQLQCKTQQVEELKAQIAVLQQQLLQLEQQQVKLQ